VGGKGWKEKKNTTQKHNQKPTKTLIVSLKAAHWLQNSNLPTSGIPVRWTRSLHTSPVLLA